MSISTYMIYQSIYLLEMLILEVFFGCTSFASSKCPKVAWKKLLITIWPHCTLVYSVILE